eukprot:scaffold17817_cov86-Skeletonema_menzelii.AAC.1
MKRLNLPLLLILCICPFGFHSIGTYNEAKALNTCRASDNNAVCPLIDSGFRGEPVSTDLPLCPREERENEIGPDKRVAEGRSPSFSSLTALQRLIYEIVAGAAAARHASTTLPSSATAHDKKRPPKRIKKFLPGLKRKRWRAQRPIGRTAPLPTSLE